MQALPREETTSSLDLNRRGSECLQTEYGFNSGNRQAKFFCTVKVGQTNEDGQRRCGAVDGLRSKKV